MKKFLKRYWMFLALLAANIIIGLLLPEIGLKSIEITKKNALEMLSILPPIFILLGLLDVWVERETMIKYMGKGSGMKGILIAFLIGSAAAGPLYASFPLASVMLKKGSSIFNIFIFVGAWSATKIPMLTFEAASLGLPFMLIRLGISIVGIFIIAILMNRSLKEEDKVELYDINNKSGEVQ